MLIGAQRRARVLGIVMRLAAPSVPVAELLRLTGLDRSLTICPDLRGALAAERHEPANPPRTSSRKVDPVRARVMYAVQQGLAASTLQDVMGVPAWKSHPSWFLVAGNDQAIPPDAERQFAKRMGAVTVEVPAGHLAMVSHPDDVAQLIKTAAEAGQTAH